MAEYTCIAYLHKQISANALAAIREIYIAEYLNANDAIRIINDNHYNDNAAEK